MLNPSAFFSPIDNEAVKDIQNDPIAKKILTTDDPYEILGIPGYAPEEEIIAAYKTLIFRYHPDKQNENDKALATQISEKITSAKTIALDKIAASKTTVNLSLSLHDHDTFTMRVRNVVLKELLTFNLQHMHLLNTEIANCLGMVLRWIHETLAMNSAPYLQKLKSAFSSESEEELLAVANDIHRFIPSNINEALIKRQFDAFLTKTVNQKDFVVSSGVNIAWNFEIEDIAKLLDDFIVLHPDTPFMLHSGYDENPHFLGVIYRNEKFHIFSPYYLSLDENYSLIPLDKEEALRLLLNHFYMLGTYLTYEPVSVTTSIGICSFEKKTSAEQHDHLALVAQQDFFNFALSITPQQLGLDARRILESVRNCFIEGMLSEAYKKFPEQFTTSILCEFLEEAIKSDHISFALEICYIDPDNKPRVTELSRYYINHYFLQAKNYNQLPTIIARFSALSNDLTQLIDANLKNANANLPQDVATLSHDPAIVELFFSLGFKLTDNQREKLVRHLSHDIYTLSQRFPVMSISFGKESEATRLKNKLTIFNLLLSAGYSLRVGNGHPESEYPFMAFLNTKQDDLLKRLCATNIFNLTAVNDKGRTVLNLVTERKNWELVEFLLNIQAPYETGPTISFAEIPPLAAWMNDVEQLRFVYPISQPEWLLTCRIKEENMLCVALKLCKTEIVEFLLNHGFLKLLQENPCLYLYQAGSPDTVKFLWKYLPEEFIANPGKLEQISPDDYKKYISFQEIKMQAPNAGSFPPLLGASMGQVDNLIATLSFPHLTKISSHGSNVVFYSCSQELTDILCLYAFPPHLKRELASINQAVSHPQIGKIPDVSFYINQVIKLFCFIENAMKIIHEKSNPRDFINYLTENEKKDFIKEIYINNFQCFSLKKKPIGLKITYRNDQTVCDFRFIDDMRVLCFNDFLSETDPPDLLAHRELSKLKITATVLLRNIHCLKCVFEEMFSVSFTSLDSMNFPKKHETRLDSLIMLYQEKLSKFKSEMDEARESERSRFRP